MKQVESFLPDGSRPNKKRVGEQPICSERRIKLIDPIWRFGRVPGCFWNELENRRDYLLWLGQKLRFRRMKHWYRLTHADILSHGGGGLANVYWHGSPVCAVKECFPEYDWQEWLFIQVPAGFYDDLQNNRRYMAWLGTQLGFRKIDDWYRVTTADFQKHRGGACLMDHRSSASQFVAACYPEYDWKPWLFERAPNGFWKNRKTCRQYLKWLGERLGYKRLDDWYNVKLSDFLGNQGLQLTKRHIGSVASIVMTLIPRREWHEWKFTRVPPGFWKDPKNIRRYVEWLGRQLRCRHPHDWLSVRRADFIAKYGGSLLGEYRSHWSVLKIRYPREHWPKPRKLCMHGPKKGTPGRNGRACVREREESFSV